MTSEEAEEFFEKVGWLRRGHQMRDAQAACTRECVPRVTCIQAAGSSGGPLVYGFSCMGLIRCIAESCLLYHIDRRTA
jgi:hypothetical protein